MVGKRGKRKSFEKMKNENKKMILEGIKEKREGKDFKIGFWNVAGLTNEDGDF